MSQVFANEEAMMAQLRAMGMPPAMLANLTAEQKSQMFAMVSDPEVIARAQERVVHEDEWKEVAPKESGGGSALDGGYQWKNSRDDVFLKFRVGGKCTKKDVNCAFEEERVTVTVAGKCILEKQPFQPIDAKESTWELREEDGTLVVSLRKARAPMRWLSVFR